jgi:hypothetical protein
MTEFGVQVHAKWPMPRFRLDGEMVTTVKCGWFIGGIPGQKTGIEIIPHFK